MTGFFPENTAYALCRISQSKHNLHSDEENYISKASEKRRREFVAGRQCAKLACNLLGSPTEKILRNPDRSPIWPENIVGSISHSNHVSGAIVSYNQYYAGLGLDIEKNHPLKDSVIEYFTNPEEYRYIKKSGYDYLGPLFFSAKESVYKCISQALNIKLNFSDISINIDDQNTYSVVFKKHEIKNVNFIGRYKVKKFHIYSLAATTIC